MASIVYTPASAGGWLALGSGSRLLVVDGVTDAALVTSLLAAVADTAGFQPVVNALVKDGLDAMPPFALIDLNGTAARVIVRGDISVQVGAETIDGSGVSTWTERVLDPVSTLTVSVALATPIAGVPPLPLHSGGAWVAAVTVSAGTGSPVAVARQPTSPVEKAAPIVPPAAVPSVQPIVNVDPELTVTDLSEAPDVDPAGREFDYLFGETVFRNVADAAVHQPVEGETEADAEPVPATATAAEGDHDGETVMSADIAKLRERKKGKTPAPARTAAAANTMVLVLPSGTREPLTQPLLVGRSPSVAQVSGDQMPKLLTVGAPDSDLSRTHARISLEGGTVVVTDLHSKNGTMIALPGTAPQRLRAGEPTSVVIGTVIDLGSGVTMTVAED
jgi:hypothetical protein